MSSYRLCVVAALTIALCGSVGASAAPLTSGSSAWETGWKWVETAFGASAKHGCGIDPLGHPICSDSAFALPWLEQGSPGVHSAAGRHVTVAKPLKHRCGIDPNGVMVCIP
jgi:hypothetical protein